MTSLPAGDERRGVFGRATLAELPRVVEELGLARVLLLTGTASFTTSGAAGVLPALRDVAEVRVWSDFSPNPEVDDLLVGSDIARSFRPDGIVAIGGGSVLDMAKLVAAFGNRPPEEIPEAVRANSVGERAPALILVPTTSGSGSEATHFAVAYIGEEKYSVADQALLPDYVILDPSLTESASPYQKATSVIDAVAQAVESHWARGATTASRTFAHDALVELVGSAPGFVSGDGPAADLAARGSYLAGRAIDLSKTTGAHAMAYGLTRRHGISHGHAVAITLGAFARRHAAAVTSPTANDRLPQDLEDLAALLGAPAIDRIGDRLDDLAAGLGLELRLSELGVPRSDLPTLAGAVNQQRLGNNPLALDEKELLDLLESCW